MEPIDIVMTWVDGNDPEWQAERALYNTFEGDKGIIRFRNWDNLQYIFRGIEKFMPWVHKVYFITWGHLPKWLNKENPKLVIVKHNDYIPSQYLPTFNSNAIELNAFRIKDLSEQYINFNDDMFVIKLTKPEDFFENGKPKDMAVLSPQPIKRDAIRNIEINNLKIINDYFTMKDVKKHLTKWLNIRCYGIYVLRTLIFMRFQTIVGIYVQHIPISHLKSVVKTIWEKEYNECNATCLNKFRTIADINDWLSRSWQLMSGNFIPRSKKFGVMVGTSNVQMIHNVLTNTKYKMICINDDLDDNEKFEVQKTNIIKELDRILPDKCSFEI